MKKIITIVVIIFAITISIAFLYWWKIVADSKIREMEEARIETKQKETLRLKEEHRKNVISFIENKIIDECLAIEDNKGEEAFCKCKAYTVTYNTKFLKLEDYYNSDDERKKVIWKSLIENNEKIQRLIKGCTNQYSDKYIENIAESMLKDSKNSENEKIKDTLKICIREELENINSKLDLGLMYIKCMLVSHHSK